MILKKISSIFMFAAAAIVLHAETVEWDTYPDTWIAVDELGRAVATSESGWGDKGVDNSQIGMFYYLWHKQHGDSGKDISKLLEENPSNPAWGPEGSYHWGSKPWLGYYSGGDDFIVAKHMQMLVDAGIDFIFFDCTNSFYYQTCVDVVLNELKRRDELGMKFPKAAFMLHSSTNATINKIYNIFYKGHPENDKYWYQYKGKPLMLANLAEVTNSEIKNYFTFRNSWAWMKGASPNEWAWLEYYPQAQGWTRENGAKVNEQISVSVAQHATTKVGKSYHAGKQPKIDKYGQCVETPQGLYFEEQWTEARRVHPPVVMVTQFNEWIAQRFVISSTSQYGDCRPGATAKIGESYFVDVYSPEFSRDLEPSAHPSVRDNYYLQLVSNVHKYRGVNKIPEPTKSLTIDIDGPWSQWDDETLEFRDDRGDTEYTSRAVQIYETFDRESNDIVRAKVTKNADTYFFYVETMDTMTPFKSSKRWMRLLINSDCDYTNGWNGYDYLIQKDDANGTLALYTNISPGNFSWAKVRDVTFRQEGNKLMLRFPRAAIGHDKGNKDFDFKWIDNMPQNVKDIMQFISNGDAAPNGRFNYRYKGSKLVGLSDISNVSNSKALTPEITPATDGITVNLSLCEEPAEISIFDLQGRLIASADAPALQTTNLRLPSGFYLVKAVMNSECFTENVRVK